MLQITLKVRLMAGASNVPYLAARQLRAFHEQRVAREAFDNDLFRKLPPRMQRQVQRSASRMIHDMTDEWLAKWDR